MKNYKFFIYLIFCFGFSQNENNLLIILNEGHFNYALQEIVEPVKIGIYDLESELYAEPIIINEARFASDMIINDNFLYVAADNRLIKYDLNSFEIIENIEIIGVRNLAIHENNL